MIPEAKIEVSAQLPKGARFWVPDEDDLTEDGFGWFRDTWLITDVPLSEAHDVVDEESRMVAVAAELAGDPREFESIAAAIEFP